ncbi:hypothetical protein HJG60_010056 [Phyllostomus discolor]|uniref:Uncharacterized protein n=1 Tax=Phyllostomus discolor TaxID=89673 RepID=A0A834B1V8_9CHIR|nr:hypothetical protein HJG60_010056 [Phyllostomus discolor]
MGEAPGAWSAPCSPLALVSKATAEATGGDRPERRSVAVTRLWCGWGWATCLADSTGSEGGGGGSLVLVQETAAQRSRAPSGSLPAAVCPLAPSVPLSAGCFPFALDSGSASRGRCPRMPSQLQGSRVEHPLLCPHGGCCGVCVSRGLGQGRTPEEVGPHFV